MSTQKAFLVLLFTSLITLSVSGAIVGVNCQENNTTIGFEPDTVLIPFLAETDKAAVVKIGFRISNVQNLKAVVLAMTFNDTFLRFYYYIEWGNLSSAGGKVSFGSEVNDPAYVRRLYVVLDAPASGSGILFIFVLQPVALGPSQLVLTETLLIDADNKAIPHTIPLSPATVHTVPFSVWVDTRFLLLQAAFQTLSENYTALAASYERMEQQYAELGLEYGALSRNYTALARTYDDLLRRHNSLVSDYQSLNSTFQELNSDYLALTKNLESLRADYEALLAGSLLARNAVVVVSSSALVLAAVAVYLTRLRRPAS